MLNLEEQIKQADIPTNIKWENRQAKQKQYTKKRILTILKIATASSLTLVFVFILRY
jgi:hypothetical protein